MSKRIKPTVSDDEFNKAMNFGTTKKKPNTKNNANTNSTTKATINSVLNNKDDIDLSNLNISELSELKNDSDNMLNKNESAPLNNKIKDTVKTTRTKLKKTTTNIKDKSYETLNKLVDRIKETPDQKKKSFN